MERRRDPLSPEEIGNLREKLAALEHEQWARWALFQLANPLQEERKERWRRQIETPYALLSEPEKDQDREWADKVLRIVLEHLHDK